MHDRELIARIETYYDPAGVDRAAIERSDITAQNADEQASITVAGLAAVSGYHAANVDRWRNLPISQRYVEVRVADGVFYVYLHQIDADGEDLHIQTQTASVPERWLDCWPANDGTIRRYLHRQLDLGGTRITTLEA